ncbi:MAG: hypothetical protein AAGA54_24035 [Myxococcota bacterium]
MRCAWVLALVAIACGSARPPVDDAGLGYTTGCGDASCESGLRIVLAANGTFTPGSYGVSTVADGVVDSCGFSVGGTELCGADAPCLLDDDCGVEPNLIIAPHSVAVRVGPGAPERVTVSVTRGGSEIVFDEFAPAYDEFAPAGPDCEPVCLVASAQLDIP